MTCSGASSSSTTSSGFAFCAAAAPSAEIISASGRDSPPAPSFCSAASAHATVARRRTISCSTTAL
eukprot:CAMPEP_0195084566 /NCGR_PEP_ID=MMETSP0448-20130528/25229_1 /TAXON_ID=66468 /ORGANISM="Heterocapsa triquestra, Strain CCMP 448" /LENGTH=65 /DNA_ID=CAMNT_0040117901 /DNA_START=43 /DNA_END=237 /DNA_ORIENTATION=-